MALHILGKSSPPLSYVPSLTFYFETKSYSVQTDLELAIFFALASCVAGIRGIAAGASRSL